MTSEDLPQTLAIFPLNNAVLFPGGLLPLNIFEERYVRMIDDALKNNRMIGMVQPRDNAEKHNPHDNIVNVGCGGRIIQFNETEDDRYLIVLQGVCRFTVEEEMKTVLPYRQVKPDWSPYEDDMVDGHNHIDAEDEFFHLLKHYLDHVNMKCEWPMIEKSSLETLLATLPMICPFEAIDKQALLEAKTPQNRYDILKSLLTMQIKSRNGCSGGRQ